MHHNEMRTQLVGVTNGLRNSGFASRIFQHQFEITRLVTSLAESGFKMFGRLIGHGSASLVTDQVPLVFFASMK